MAFAAQNGPLDRFARYAVAAHPQTRLEASRKVGEILVAMLVFGAKMLSPNLQTPEDQSHTTSIDGDARWAS
jgi:hypothetical protein